MTKISNVADLHMRCRRSCQAAEFEHQPFRSQCGGADQGLASEGNGFSWVIGCHHQ